ncbi:EAL domain-containing protein [Deinococcus sp. KSM4-11]|uniref:putative bifunctional diguanylate cyclase/phosphodiesterase n=1 Tax=Deinococcus sp. KSM4-11 TaxID=2568654 RepID=UPI0010A48FFE|nr:EAL domain-containing protein [Deinococcus sp. KSM4-11]THF84357.1 EAL domain-containing protein [Deinococcus sp. KSM4-11]
MDSSELSGIKSRRGIVDVGEEQRRLEALYTYSILDSLPEPQFDRLVTMASQFFEMPMALVTFVDEDRQWFKARVGMNEAQTPRTISFCSLAIAQDGVMVIPDATEDQRLQAYPNVTGDPHLRFYAGAPLLSPYGHKLGTFCVLDHRPREFTAEQEALLQSFAAMTMDALNLRQAVRELGSMALHDTLTGLPNRAYFRQLLTQACRRAESSGEKVVVGLLDLNRFKVINDTLGHAVGDELLQQVSQRLKHATATSDVTARMCGDEFTLLLTDVRSAEDAESVIRRIVAAFDPPFRLGGQETFIRCSVGLSLYPDNTQTPDTLLSQADAAMYRVKRAGGGYAFFNTDLDQRTPIAIEQLTALHHAIERDELRLVFQPLVEARTLHVVGHEALLRWMRPSGVVSPLTFIPLAEASGLIVPIGRWVLRAAAEAVSRGQISRVSVNVSAVEFQQPDFVSHIEAVVRETRIVPHQLCLELTESCLLEPERYASIIQQLSDLGIHTALDDFGTGYSSLTALAHLPVKILKIDRSFTAEVGEPTRAGRNALAVMHGVVTIARAYGLATVAEGVETTQQAQALRDVGCTFLQGYLYGRPLHLPAARSSLETGAS